MIEKRYRTMIGADERAMAGLSLGGIHVLNNGLTRSDIFHYVGIFSIGLGMSYGPAGIKIGDPAVIAEYENKNGEALKRAAKDLKLVYYGFGTEDPMRGSLKPTLAVFDKYNIRYTYQESGGGHTWTNWRHYLYDFAPRLFR
jgi:enterochelin esterase family protein